MQRRNSLWLLVVILLLGVIFLREPKLQQSENIFLRWLLRYSQPRGALAPLTVIEIGTDPIALPDAEKEPAGSSREAELGRVSPLEFALFLQSILEFKPTVVAFENILHWRARDRDQEQVFLDQAMRVPRLLVASELTTDADPDAPVAEIPAFNQVLGKRGELVDFTGVAHQPAEDLRLISTAGFVNLPDEIFDGIHVPLLFRYRGEVIPSFTLQAVMSWLRVTTNEIKIDLGAPEPQIELPNGRRIPIASDGTMLVAPNAARKARRLSLNELLLAAQEHDKGRASAPELESLRDEIVLARVPTNPLSPPDVFAATIATIQNQSYVRRINVLFDCIALVVIAVLGGQLQKFLRIDLLLGGIAFTAAYCLVALTLVERRDLWLPGILPLGAVWLLIFISMFLPNRNVPQRATAIILPPPLP